MTARAAKRKEGRISIITPIAKNGQVRWQEARWRWQFNGAWHEVGNATVRMLLNVLSVLSRHARSVLVFVGERYSSAAGHTRPGSVQLAVDGPSAEAFGSGASSPDSDSSPLHSPA